MCDARNCDGLWCCSICSTRSRGVNPPKNLYRFAIALLFIHKPYHEYIPIYFFMKRDSLPKKYHIFSLSLSLSSTQVLLLLLSLLCCFRCVNFSLLERKKVKSCTFTYKKVCNYYRNSSAIRDIDIT